MSYASELRKEQLMSPYTILGVEISGRPIVRDHHFLGKDDHVLTDGSPSAKLIFALAIVHCEEGALSMVVMGAG
jgi:hypothetical protein